MTNLSPPLSRLVNRGAVPGLHQQNIAVPGSPRTSRVHRKNGIPKLISEVGMGAIGRGRGRGYCCAVLRGVLKGCARRRRRATVVTVIWIIPLRLNGQTNTLHRLGASSHNTIRSHTVDHKVDYNYDFVLYMSKILPLKHHMVLNDTFRIK